MLNDDYLIYLVLSVCVCVCVCVCLRACVWMMAGLSQSSPTELTLGLGEAAHLLCITTHKHKPKGERSYMAAWANCHVYHFP